MKNIEKQLIEVAELVVQLKKEDNKAFDALNKLLFKIKKES